MKWRILDSIADSLSYYSTQKDATQASTDIPM